ncbi:MAG: hypothetical protein EKK61_00115 [Rickettsiales bacterium]|nr:MAG: hypothetical protein EKK61_00115 [Rickettsiales bacterium]
MSNRRRTLNIQSIAYNASTNTPSLANMVDGAVYKVSVEGIQTIGGTSKFCAVNDLIVNVGGVTSFLHVSNVNFNASTGLTTGGTTVTQSQLTETGRKIYITASGKITGGTVVNGTTGGNSYLIVGDTLETINNVLTITSQINSGSIINVGTGGLFSNMSVANDYLNLRNYVDVTLNLLSATTETSSIDIENRCGGKLRIFGNGFTIQMGSGFNLNLSGDNIVISNFKVSGNSNGYLLEVDGSVIHQNNLTVTNTNATGHGIIHTKSLKSLDDNEAIALSSVTISVANVANVALVGRNSSFSCLNLTTNGWTTGLRNGDFYISGSVNTGGGYFEVGESGSLSVDGSVNTGGGDFYGGASSSYTIHDSVNTGGGYFHGGASSSYTISGSVNTGGGDFYGGVLSSYSIFGSVNTGGGYFHAGDTAHALINSSINGNVGSYFGFEAGTRLYVKGSVTGYTVIGFQCGQAMYIGATSVAVLRNQNTNTLMAN